MENDEQNMGRKRKDVATSSSGSRSEARVEGDQALNLSLSLSSNPGEGDQALNLSLSLPSNQGEGDQASNLSLSLPSNPGDGDQASDLSLSLPSNPGEGDQALNLSLSLPSNPNPRPGPLVTRYFLDKLDRPIEGPLITRNFLDNLDQPINQQQQPENLPFVLGYPQQPQQQHQGSRPSGSKAVVQNTPTPVSPIGHRSNNFQGFPPRYQQQRPQQQQQCSRPSGSNAVVQNTPTPVCPIGLRSNNFQGFPPRSQQQRPQQQQRDSGPSGSNAVVIGGNAVVQNTHTTVAPIGLKFNNVQRFPVTVVFDDKLMIIPHPPSPLNVLKTKNIGLVSGKSKCRECKKMNVITFIVQSMFQEVAEFIRNEKDAMNNVAHAKWDNPTLPTCGICGHTCDIIMPTSDIEIDWLFLLLGQWIGVCTEEQLEVRCIKRGLKSTGHRLELLYRVYMDLCRELAPDEELFRVPNQYVSYD